MAEAANNSGPSTICGTSYHEQLLLKPLCVCMQRESGHTTYMGYLPGDILTNDKKLAVSAFKSLHRHHRWHSVVLDGVLMVAIALVSLWVYSPLVDRTFNHYDLGIAAYGAVRVLDGYIPYADCIRIMALYSTTLEPSYSSFSAQTYRRSSWSLGSQRSSLQLLATGH